MKIHMADGESVLDIPKVKGGDGVLAMGTCTRCGLSFGDWAGIIEHASVECSEGDGEENRGRIAVRLNLSGR